MTLNGNSRFLNNNKI